jgi:hypothetical protein
MQTVRFFLGTGLFAASVILAAPGCSDKVPPKSKATLQSHVQPGSGAAAGKCLLASTEWLDIGRIGSTSNPPETGDVVPIEDGAPNTSDDPSFNGGGVSVTCSVTKSGDGFTVFASVSLSSAAGAGSFTVQTASGATFTGNGPEQNVQATFQSGQNGGQFKGTACSIAYTRPDGSGVDTTGNGNGMGVAPGRLWGYLTCADTVNSGTKIQNGTADESCSFSAEFRFENCAQ